MHVLNPQKNNIKIWLLGKNISFYVIFMLMKSYNAVLSLTVFNAKYKI